MCSGSFPASLADIPHPTAGGVSGCRYGAAMAKPRDPRSEAESALGSGWKPLVLEPSPPAVLEEPFADDPVAAPLDDATVVSPLERAGAGHVTWSDLVGKRPELADFAAERWLAAWPRLQPLPDDFAASRLGLHRVGAYLLSPARRQANTKIGLRHTLGGFGTPFYVAAGDDNNVASQVRMAGTELVHQRGTEARSHPVTTLSAAGDFLGIAPDAEWASQFDIPEPGPLDADLNVSPQGAAALADWFGFAYAVLEQLRADAESAEASNPQLWPEHFDPAIEIGSDQAKQRASYGASPGDAGEANPYLYVAAWYGDVLGDDPFWNSGMFSGALLTYDTLLVAEDQRQAALDFYRAGRRLLLG